MVYYPRNSSRRIIDDREPPRRGQSYYGPDGYHHGPARRDYNSRQQSDGFHHPLAVKPTSWVPRRNDRQSNFDDYRRHDYGYRRNYHAFRRISANVTVRSYKTYQSSSSRISRPNYGIESGRRYRIPPRMYNQKQTSRPYNYHGRKMQHWRIKSHNNQFQAASVTDKQHFPPPPSLPESDVMMTDQTGSRAVSSPSYGEEGEFMRSCSPVLDCSPALSSPSYSEEGELRSCSPALECLKL